MTHATDRDRAPLVRLAEPVPDAPCGLTASECRLCSALPLSRRADFRAGRLAARRAAAAAAGVPVRSVEIEPGAAGGGCDEDAGPAAFRGGAVARVTGVEIAPTLSISHRDGRAVAVADRAARRVGVDMERAGTVPPGTERYFLSETEREALSFIDATTLWSMKEAAWKALGCTDATPFTSLELRFDVNQRLETVLLGGRSHPAGAEVSTLPGGYVMAVVWLEAAA